MKVKVGELKTHLSRYLKDIAESGEYIEVCVRDKPVAYLTSASKANAPSAATREQTSLQTQLNEEGLIWIPRQINPPDKPELKPQLAGDQKKDVNTTDMMRQEKNW